MPIDIGAPLATLNTDGSSLPQIGDVSQVVAGKPFWRLALQAERTWQVHALGDVAFTAPLLERGRYDPAETYREGNIVDLEDGSRWLYTATTPTAGNAPSTDSTFWSSLSAPIRATYDDGTPVQDWKPAQPGADVTGDNTSKDTKAVAGTPADALVAALKAARDQLAYIDGTTIPTINQSVTDAGKRIDAARTAASDALADAVKLLDDSDAKINQRIDSVAAEGGYDDTAVYAEVMAT